MLELTSSETCNSPIRYTTLEMPALHRRKQAEKESEMNVLEAFEVWIQAQMKEGWRTKEIDPFDAFMAGWDACEEEDVSK